MDKITKADMDYANKLVNEHWSYIQSLLEMHDIDEYLIKMIGFHYRSSGIHFFKHALEYSLLQR